MKYVFILFGLGLLLNDVPTYAHVHEHKSAKDEVTSNSNRSISIEKMPVVLVPNKPVTIRFKLVQNNKALTLNELNEVHTKKIHVLIIDSSLKDYHHIHPVQDSKKQDFVFNFTPKSTNAYQMWVDITPSQTNKQEFIVTNLNKFSSQPVVKGKTVLKSTISPYEFTLNLDSQPKAGHDVMASINVTQNGKPFTKLEPIMGAFAHVVGFSGDHSSVLHIHPMGKEPEKESDRGGSTLMFHINLNKPGFVKLFAQFQIDGQDVYAPFAINVGK